MTKLTKQNQSDRVLAEIHEIRRRIAESFGGDIHSITRDAAMRQEASGRRTVSYASDERLQITQSDSTVP